jgi:HAD superfamily hydrolase (TIGR01490 family)
MKKKLALFDFDGTITRNDSMFAFIAFARSNEALVMSLILLSPIMLLHKLGIVSAGTAKKRLLSYHFKGVSKSQMDLWAKDFCDHRLVMLFNDLALEKLHFHRSKGHEVYVVTASLDMWVMPWMEEQGLKCICTKAKFVNGVFSGDFETPNCQGKEKVRRLEEVIKKDDFIRVYAYGDSRGDREMLAWAHTGFYRRFI